MCQPKRCPRYIWPDGKICNAPSHTGSHFCAGHQWMEDEADRQYYEALVSVNTPGSYGYKGLAIRSIEVYMPKPAHITEGKP